MKKADKKKIDDDMRPEYDFDFSKSKPNPYSKILRDQENLIMLEPDVAEYYKTSEQVNNTLRAIISTFPLERKITTPQP